MLKNILLIRLKELVKSTTIYSLELNLQNCKNLPQTIKTKE